jgi:hypothetical protein
MRYDAWEQKKQGGSRMALGMHDAIEVMMKGNKINPVKDLYVVVTRTRVLFGECDKVILFLNNEEIVDSFSCPAAEMDYFIRITAKMAEKNREKEIVLAHISV